MAYTPVTGSVLAAPRKPSARRRERERACAFVCSRWRTAAPTRSRLATASSHASPCDESVARGASRVRAARSASCGRSWIQSWRWRSASPSRVGGALRSSQATPVLCSSALRRAAAGRGARRGRACARRARAPPWRRGAPTPPRCRPVDVVDPRRRAAGRHVEAGAVGRHLAEAAALGDQLGDVVKPARHVLRADARRRRHRERGRGRGRRARPPREHA